MKALFICTFVRIYKFRSLQERPSKPAHFNWSPQLDSVTSNHIFKKRKKWTTFLKREKNGKDEKKRRIVLNGGRERMELKKLKKQAWSTRTYSGEVPEEMRWKDRDMNS